MKLLFSACFPVLVYVEESLSPSLALETDAVRKELGTMVTLHWSHLKGNQIELCRPVNFALDLSRKRYWKISELLCVHAVDKFLAEMRPDFIEPLPSATNHVIVEAIQANHLSLVRDIFRRLNSYMLYGLDTNAILTALIKDGTRESVEIFGLLLNTNTSINLYEHQEDIKDVHERAVKHAALVAAKYNSMEVLELIATCQPGLIRSHVKQILKTAVKAGHRAVVRYISDNHYNFVYSSYEEDKLYAFLECVLVLAAEYGHEDIALDSVAQIPLNILKSCTKEFNCILYYSCWWGMVDFIESLEIDDPKYYFTTDLPSVLPVTLFDVVVGNGLLAKMSSQVSSFPIPLHTHSISELAQLHKDITDTKGDKIRKFLNFLTQGWSKNVLAMSSTAEESFHQQIDVRHSASALDIFIGALGNGNNSIVQGFFEAFGSYTAGILYGLHQLDIPVLKLVILRHSKDVFESIVKALFDADTLDELVTLEALEQVLVVDDASYLHLLRSCVKSYDFAAMSDSKGTLLHRVALHSCSQETARAMLDLIGSVGLSQIYQAVTTQGYTALDYALSQGNAFVASFVLAEYARASIALPETICELTTACRWFQHMMEYAGSIEDDNTQVIKLSTIVQNKFNIRSISTAAKIYGSIKDSHPIMARYLLQASCGLFNVSLLARDSNGITFATSIIENPSNAVALSVSLMTSNRIIEVLKNGALMQLVQKGNYDVVLSILKEIDSIDKSLLQLVNLSGLFVTSCTSLSLALVEQLLMWPINETELFQGFVSAIALGGLEIAAYIVLNSGKSWREFLKCITYANAAVPLSKFVRLLFFGKPTDIVRNICSVPSTSSRMSMAQTWLQHTWGKHQYHLFQPRLHECQEIIENLQVTPPSDYESKLTIDLQSFSSCVNTEASFCPLFGPVLVYATCVSQLFPVSDSPPSISLASLLPDAPVDQIILSCVLHPSPPRATHDGYHGSIVLSYRPKEGVFLWPLEHHEVVENRLTSPTPSPVFPTNIELALKESIMYHIVKSRLVFPMTAALEMGLTDLIEDQIDVWSMKALVSTITLCVEDILSILELIPKSCALYNEVGVLPDNFKHWYSPIFILQASLVADVHISLDVSTTKGVSAQLIDRHLKVAVVVEMAQDGYDTLEFSYPNHQSILNAIATCLLSAELLSLQRQFGESVQSFLAHFSLSVTSMRVHLQSRGELYSLRDNGLPLQCLYQLKFADALTRFLGCFFTTLSQLEEKATFSLFPGSCNMVITEQAGKTHIEPDNCSLVVSASDAYSQHLHTALSLVFNKLITFHGIVKVAREVPASFTSKILVNELVRVPKQDLLNHSRAQICNVLGEPLYHSSLSPLKQAKKMVRLSAQVNDCDVRRSPCTMFSALTKYPVCSSMEITTIVKRPIEFVAAHPEGGCGHTPKLVLPGYVTVRQKFDPSFTPQVHDLESLAATQPLHYLSFCYHREKGFRNLHIPSIESTNRHIHIKLASVNDEDDAPIKESGQCVTYSSAPLGSGLYHVALMSSVPLECELLVACCTCQCAMMLHWPGSAITYTPVKYRVRTGPASGKSYVTTTPSTSLQPYKWLKMRAGNRLEFFIHLRDEGGNKCIQSADECLPTIYMERGYIKEDGTLGRAECVATFEKPGLARVISDTIIVAGSNGIFIETNNPLHPMHIGTVEVSSCRMPHYQYCEVYINDQAVTPNTVLAIHSNTTVTCVIYLYDIYRNIWTGDVKSIQAFLLTKRVNIPPVNPLNMTVYQLDKGVACITFQAPLARYDMLKICCSFSNQCEDIVTVMLDILEPLPSPFEDRYKKLMSTLKSARCKRATHTMTIDRENILESAVSTIKAVDFEKVIRVRFGEELGIDEGGVSR